MITSSSNANIRHVIALQKKGKVRREWDAFVVEGKKMFSEVPKERLIKTYVSESFEKEHESEPLLAGAAYELVSDKVFREMADTQTPQGILAVVRQYHYTLKDILDSKDTPHIILLEDIQDPGNLGTILRAGEGAGITGAVMSKGCVDIYNPKVIRSTMGSVYRIPFFYVEQLSEALADIKKVCSVYAAHLKGECDYDLCDYKKGTAILIGNEANGLSENICSMADTLVKIPMRGQVESLNAAVAASVFMYEISRQRRRVDRL